MVSCCNKTFDRVQILQCGILARFQLISASCSSMREQFGLGLGIYRLLFPYHEFSLLSTRRTKISRAENSPQVVTWSYQSFIGDVSICFPEF